MTVIAGAFVQFNHYLPTESRQSYAALLLIPGLEPLRFHYMLRALKKKWNASEPRYSSFWNAKDVISTLAKQKLDWENVKEIRDRLIIMCRLVMLCRSIDLARTWRQLHSLKKKCTF